MPLLVVAWLVLAGGAWMGAKAERPKDLTVGCLYQADRDRLVCLDGLDIYTWEGHGMPEDKVLDDDRK